MQTTFNHLKVSSLPDSGLLLYSTLLVEDHPGNYGWVKHILPTRKTTDLELPSAFVKASLAFETDGPMDTSWEWAVAA